MGGVVRHAEGRARPPDRRIVDLVTELNDRVYHLYDLTRDEIAIVERVTK